MSPGCRGPMGGCDGGTHFRIRVFFCMFCEGRRVYGAGAGVRIEVESRLGLNWLGRAELKGES